MSDPLPPATPAPHPEPDVRPRFLSRTWWAKNKLLVTWGLLLLSARLSLGPSSLIVLLSSKKALNDVANARPDMDPSVDPKSFEILKEWAISTHNRQVTMIWRSAILGTIVYFAVIALILSFFRTRNRIDFWSGVVLFTICLAMLLYGLANRDGTVYTSWWGN